MLEKIKKADVMEDPAGRSSRRLTRYRAHQHPLVCTVARHPTTFAWLEEFTTLLRHELYCTRRQRQHKALTADRQLFGFTRSNKVNESARDVQAGKLDPDLVADLDS